MIAALLTSMLKTTGSSKKLAPKMFRANDDEVVGGDSGKTNKTIVNLSKKIINSEIWHVCQISEL